MTSSDWWQLSGGMLEVLGLFTVALGISDARAKFTNRPSLLQKIRNFLVRVAVKLKLRKPKTVYASGTATATASGSARGRVGFGFQGSLDERVKRLQEIAQRHENMISDLQGHLEDEKAERKRGDEQVADRLSASERRLEERISEAAAGALTLETWGVALFVLGVACTTYGGLVS